MDGSPSMLSAYTKQSFNGQILPRSDLRSLDGLLNYLPN
jgi:hypothetical protein